MKLAHIIINSMKEAFFSIWKNKMLFLSLFVLQIVFLAAFSIISFYYQTKILSSSKAIADYLSRQQLDEVSVGKNILDRKNILGDDPLSISRNFGEIKSNFQKYLFYAFISLTLFMSLSWAIINKITDRASYSQLLKNFFKILIILLFYLGLIFSFFYSLLNISFSQAAENTGALLGKYLVFFLVSIALVYFMFVSLSLIGKTNLKEIIQETLEIGIKKAHYVLSVYFINFVLFAACVFLLVEFLEGNLFLFFLSIALMIFSLIFGKLFMVSVMGKLT